MTQIFSPDHWTRVVPDETKINRNSDGALRKAIAALNATPDRTPQDMRASVETLAGHGLLVAPLSREFGGRGLGSDPDTVEEAVRVLGLIGSEDLPLARLYEGHMNALHLINAHGSPSRLVRTARVVSGGGLFGVWGADGDRPLEIVHGLLEGGKRFCSGLGSVACAVVTARYDGGTQLLVLETDEPGRADADAWDMRGMRETHSGTYEFTGMSVTSGALLGLPDVYGVEPAFLGGVWRIAAAELGGVFGLIDAARAHLRERGRLEDPIQTARLGECLVVAHAARALTVSAGRFAVSLAGAQTAEKAANLSVFARLCAERAAARTLAAVADATGLEGCVTGSTVDRRHRDLSTYTRQMAPDGLLARATRALLDGAEPLDMAFDV